MFSLCVRQCSKVYVSSFKFQVQVDYRKEELESAKLDRSRIRPNWSRIAEKEFLHNFKSGPSPRKRLGLQSNLSKYKRETLATFLKTFERLVCYSLWNLRGFVPSNYTSVYQSKIFNQVVVEPSCCHKDQQLRVIWNLWMRSQSLQQNVFSVTKKFVTKSPVFRH